MFFIIITCNFLTSDFHLCLSFHVNNFHLCLSSLLLFYGWSLIETIPRKFQGFDECKFGGSEKNRYFLKIPNWQHILIWEHKRGKLAYYFLNNAAKTCSFGLKFLENIEIKHFFQSK